MVSVIIPNYCHARFLDQRIQSVLNQTYQEFEVIILDDCSPDEGASRKVIEKYRNNPHVSQIVYNEVNSGSPYKQWEKGTNLAKGELIWIAESDDYADEHFLEVLVPQFEEHEDVSVAFCRSILFNEHGVIGPAGRKYIQEGVIDGKQFIHDYMHSGTGIVNASSAIFTKEAFMNISRDYASLKGAGDRLFWILLAEKGDVAFVEKPYNYFRAHPNNTTKKFNTNGVNQKEDKLIFDYISKKGYIAKDEIPAIVREYVRIHIFEMINDKKLKKELYKIWNFSLWAQLKMCSEYWLKKL